MYNYTFEITEVSDPFFKSIKHMTVGAMDEKSAWVAANKKANDWKLIIKSIKITGIYHKAPGPNNIPGTEIITWLYRIRE